MGEQPRFERALVRQACCVGALALVVGACTGAAADGGLRGPDGLNMDQYQHMFTHYDTGWRTRECLLTLAGLEYVGVLDSPAAQHRVSPRGYKCHSWTSASRLPDLTPALKAQLDRSRFPGQSLTMNRNWCRNPGGAWEQPSCFIKDGGKEARLLSCDVPLCPVLKQFRSSPSSQEYGGRMDVREAVGCEDFCQYRHSLLGPACTLRSGAWHLYYPCNVPLMHGENVIYDLPLGPSGWGSLVPLTWYLLPSPAPLLPYGDAGATVLRLPDVSLNQEYEFFDLVFGIRLADPSDVSNFEFSLMLSPDQSLVDVVKLHLSPAGMVIGHQKRIMGDTHHKWAWLNEVRADMCCMATIMYRWLYLNLFLETNVAKLRAVGEKSDKNTLVMRADTTPLRFPRYLWLASHSGPVMATIIKVNHEGFFCVDGVVKQVGSDPWSTTWAVLPPVTPPATHMPPDRGLDTTVQPQDQDRHLHLQVHNIPFSLVMSSTPFHPKYLSHSETSGNMSSLGINVVELMVGMQKVRLVHCRVLGALDLELGHVKCARGTGQGWRVEVRRSLREGQQVLLDVRTDERSPNRSAVTISVHHTLTRPLIFNLTHPVFLRYWSLVNTKHPEFYFYQKPNKHQLPESVVTQNAFLQFRVLNQRCILKQQNFYSEQCGERQDLYTGPVTWSKTGKTCMPWSAFDMVNKIKEELPHHSFDYNENMCRTATDFDDRYSAQLTWCYTSLTRHKEACHVRQSVPQQCTEVPGFTDKRYTDDYAREILQLFPDTHMSVEEQFHRLFPAGAVAMCYAPHQVLVVNLVSHASPANPTYYLLPGHNLRKFSFELRSWSRRLYGEQLCLYLYGEKDLQVKVAIGEKSVHASGNAVDRITKWESFLVPWRFVRYCVLATNDHWTLHVDEVLDHIIKGSISGGLSRIGFDSCHESKQTKQKPTYVMVKFLPQERIPSMSQYFATDYFRSTHALISHQTMARELTTFFTMSKQDFVIWVQNGERQAHTGGVVLFLLSSIYPRPQVLSCLHLQHHRMALSSNMKEWQEMKTKSSDFHEHPLKVSLQYEVKEKQIRISAALFPSSHLKPVTLSIKPQSTGIPNYVGLYSHHSKIFWSVSEAMPPLDMHDKPRDGGWSRWVQVSCSKTCGGGTGVAVRSCSNPPPNTMGRNCSGPENTTVTCNTRPCGLISVATERLVRETIVNRNRSVRIQMFKRSEFHCRRGRVYHAVRKEYPKALFYWEHDTGHYMNHSLSEQKRPSYSPWRQRPKVYVNTWDTLVIEEALPEHAGLWTCMAVTSPANPSTVIRAIPLTVHHASDQHSRVVTVGDDLVALCRGKGLNQVTGGNLDQVWCHNGSVHQVIRKSNSVVDDILVVNNVGFHHSGLWQCYYRHRLSTVTYKTNSFRVLVMPEHASVVQDTTRMLWVLLPGLLILLLYLILNKKVNEMKENNTRLTDEPGHGLLVNIP